MLYLIGQILLGGVGLIVAGSIYQYISTKRDEKRYLVPGKLLDIGGYKLHINKTGKGSPSVILDSGMGCNSLDWALIQPEISKYSCVVSYDRAGLGWSDKSPQERNSNNIVEELHLLLEKAEIPKPYILVGHSFGGVNIRLFTHRYPKEVAGLIFVDSPHEDFLKRIPPEPSNMITKIGNNSKLWLFLSYIGLIRLLSGFNIKKSFSMFPAHIQNMILATRCTIKSIKTIFDEKRCIEESLNQIKEAGVSFDNLPLIVVSAGKYMTRKECANLYSQDYLDKLKKTHEETQKELVCRSSNGKQMIAEKSGHMIPHHQPEIIIEAIREVALKVNPLVFRDLKHMNKPSTKEIGDKLNGKAHRPLSLMS